MQENLMNFALALTSNYEDAQDLVQDTFLKVLVNSDKFTNDHNFKGWVLTVMRNIFINRYRQLVRIQKIIDSATDIHNLESVADSGFDRPDSACHIHDILRAINGLNKTLRHPFVLYLKGYRYDEIARKLRLPVSTVKSRIFSARKILKTQLKDYVGS